MDREEGFGTKVRFRREEHNLIVGDNYVHITDADNYFGPLEILEQVTLASVRRALVAGVDYYGHLYKHEEIVSELTWASIPENEFDLDTSPCEPTSLVLTEDLDLLLCVEMLFPKRDPFEPFPELEGLLGSWAAARKAELVSLKASHWTAGLWAALFRFSLRSKDVRFAQDFGNQVMALVDAYIEGTPSVDKVVGLLESGFAAALIGAPECATFECKSSLMLDREHTKLELAKDVAAIANGEAGGVIVIGLETKAREAQDRVVAIHPIHDASRLVKRARRIIDRYVFPPIDGLVVRCTPHTGSGNLIYVHVPTQTQELKPFVVSGAFVDGRVEGAMISVPRRRDDETIYLSPASLHAFLAAGYALFRGGHQSGIDRSDP